MTPQAYSVLMQIPRVTGLTFISSDVHAYSVHDAIIQALVQTRNLYQVGDDEAVYVAAIAPTGPQADADFQALISLLGLSRMRVASEAMH